MEMKNKNKYILRKAFHITIATVMLAITGCSEEEPGSDLRAPNVETYTVIDITRTTANVSGTISGHLDKITSYGVKYSTSKDFPTDGTTVVTLKEKVTEGECYTLLKDLKPNTHYYFCWFASTGTSEVQSYPSEFTTTATSKPLFGELITDSIGEDYAKIRCNVEEIGDNHLIEYGVSYRLKPKENEKAKTFTPVAADSLSDTERREFIVELKDLNPANEYEIRAYAKNSADENGDSGILEGYSDQIIVIKTDNKNSPEVTTSSIGSVTMFSAQVNGIITNDSGSEVVERGFCYSNSLQDPTIYNSTVEKVAGHELNKEYTATLIDLAMETTYYVRAYAKNIVNGSERVGYGETLQLTTLGLVEPNVTMQNIETNSTSATLHAQVTPYDKAALKERGFIWSEDDPEMTIDKANQAKTIQQVADTDSEDFSCTLEGLKSNSHYYVRAYAIYQVKDQQKIGYSNQYYSFNTSSIQTATFKDLNTNSDFSSITVSTGISNLGDGELVEKGFCWKKYDGNWSDLTLEADGVKSQKVEDGTAEKFSLTIGDLIPSTQYQVRAYAKTKIGEEIVIGYSNGYSTSTANLSINISASTTTDTSCEITGTFNNDVKGIDEYGFCWSTDPSPSTINKKQATNINDNKTFSAVIDGLTAGTTYYVRVYVVCQGVTALGNSYTEFKTKRTPNSNDNVSPDKKD